MSKMGKVMNQEDGTDRQEAEGVILAVLEETAC